MPSDSMTDAFKAFHKALQKKEETLEAKEVEFEKRVRLFEQANPRKGAPSDIIQLNVGGQTGIAVLRKTLTQFEDSMLAAMFSGRWDETLEKDSEGRVFIDQDYSDFQQLLSFLRLVSNQRGTQNSVKAPEPTFSFCSLCEYYGLMSSLYPIEPHFADGSTATSVKQCFGSLDMQTESLVTVTLLLRGSPGLKISSFDVLVRQNSAAAHVGFACDVYVEGSRSSRCTSIVGTFSYSTAVDVEKKKIMTGGEVMVSNLPINVQTGDVLIHCRVLGERVYELEVDGHPKLANRFTAHSHLSVRPAISFLGSVTIFNVMYQYPK